MIHLEFLGRSVYPITSRVEQKNYYKHLDYWRVCYENTNPLIVPTREEALEYLGLLRERDSLYCNKDKESRKRLRQLESYDAKYDWRPQKSVDGTSVGIISPTGEQLLSDSFTDVFTQFDAINSKPIFLPVSNGKAWALVSLTNPHVLMTDFKYNSIIPERWEGRLFFVQDIATKKWGVLETTYPFLRIKPYKDSMPLLKTLMPPIADEIFEDEMMTDDASLTFFMTRRDDKIGILTNFGFSEIIYDTYEVDNMKCKFRLIRHDRKRPRITDYWHPNGKMNKIKS